MIARPTRPFRSSRSGARGRSHAGATRPVLALCVCLAGLLLAHRSGPLAAGDAPAAPPSDASATVTSAPAAGPTRDAPAVAQPATATEGRPSMEVFLDRLMMAESGGRLDARNPRSTALGPFQFIESTFLYVVSRHFAAEVAGKTDEQILALRTDRDFARKAAAAFNGDNMAALEAAEISPTPANLRLAFLLGPTAAIRVLQAPAESPLNTLLPPAVIVANPFMLGMTVADLAGRAARDVDPSAPRVAARSPRRLLVRVAIAKEAAQHAYAPSRGRTLTAERAGAPTMDKAETRRAPALAVQCRRELPSCRRWIALQTRIAVARAAIGGSKRRIAQR